MDESLLQNPYRTLNVPKDATLATIRSAHRKLVLACHPDKVLDESAKKIKAEQFHQVQQAYEILSDENRRARHDEKVKLAELRAEMHAERGPPRRSESYQAPRYAGSSPVFEMRNGRVYEERVPGRSHAYEEDLFASKFAEARPSAKKFDEMYADPPPLQKRHTSGRQQDERRRMREVEEERERRERESKKAKEAAARDDKERRRAKERRKDMQAKSSRKFTYMDTDASDSEVDDRRQSSKREATPPKRRYEEVRRKSDRDEPRRSNKKEDLRRERGFEDGNSLEDMVTAAQEYMSKSREIEIEPRPRPSRKRADSNLERNPPVPPMMRPVDSRRRSSDRERSDKERSGRSGGESDRRDDRRRGGRGSRQPSPIRRDSAKKDKKFREPEIVEPVSSSRKASLPFALDPKGLKEKLTGSAAVRKETPRSSTHYQVPQESPFKHPGMRRAETMPAKQAHRNEPIPLKSSHLKNAKAPSDYDSSSSDDSDSSEETNETPEIKPRNTTHKYKVNIHPETHSPHTLYAEPDGYDSHDSPKTRRPADPPAAGGRGTNRSPPNRSMSYTVGEDRSFSHPPVTPRGDSGRVGPSAKNRGSGRSKKLFGEYIHEEDLVRPTQSPKMSSPKMSPADIRYTNKPRRSSEDIDPDAFPGSLNRSHRKPSYPRRESVY